MRKHEKTRENRDYFPAPCSAIVTKVTESVTFSFSDEKALQGAGIGSWKSEKRRENTRKAVKRCPENTLFGTRLSSIQA